MPVHYRHTGMQQRAPVDLSRAFSAWNSFFVLFYGDPLGYSDARNLIIFKILPVISSGSSSSAEMTGSPFGGSRL